MTANTIKDGLGNILTTLSQNPVATAAGAIGAGVALGVGASAVVGAIKSKKNKRSKARNSRKRTGRARDRRYISKQKHEQAYQNRRKRQGKKTYGKRYKSKKGIKYTKNGQPYKIMANGRARFIKKKGGRR